MTVQKIKNMSSAFFKFKCLIKTPSAIVLSKILRTKLDITGDKCSFSKDNFRVDCHKDFIFFFAKKFSTLKKFAKDDYVNLYQQKFDEIYFDIKVSDFVVKATMLEIDEMYPAILKYNKHYTPRKGDVVLDCGAYNGIYSFLVSQHVGNSGKIYCFEPNKKSYDVIIENIKRNNITNIVAINSALYNVTGKIKFATNFGASKVVPDAPQEQNREIIEVASLTFSDFTKMYGVTKIDFIKMDVEGAEIQIIDDFFKSNLQYKPKFAVATYHIIDGKRTDEAIENFFKKNRYTCKTENKKHLTTYAWPA